MSSEKALQTQTDARTFLTRWAEAYSQGRPEALPALYADRVLGVRRDGERTSFADRLQWLGEQTSRLRQSPGAFSVSGVRIAATAGAARVMFSYIWESGSPEQERESGRAELFLLREPGGLRIAREERRPERPLVQARPTPPTRNPDQFAFVEGMDLLLPTQVEPRWTQGALVVEPGGELLRVSRSVEPAQLPAEIVRWQGRRVQLYDLSGKRCEARVVGFKVVGRHLPRGLPQQGSVVVTDAKLLDVVRDSGLATLFACTGSMASLGLNPPDVEPKVDTLIGWTSILGRTVGVVDRFSL